MPRHAGRVARLLGCAAFAATAWPAATQDAPPAPVVTPAVQVTEATPEDMVGLTGVRDRMSVAVRIDGQGPYQFVVDTGAERTVISQELASKLALAGGGNITVHSMSSSGVVETALIPTLQVSRKAVSAIRAPKLAEAHIGALGMLGTDTLKNERVLFDFAKKKMIITRSRRSDDRIAPDAIVVTGRTLYGRLIIADATAEGQRVMVVIDTGSDITIGNEALRRKLLLKQKLPAPRPVTMVSVLGDKATADYTALQRISIGGVRVRNMPIAFADVHLFRQLDLLDRPALLLGMDSLQLFDQVAIDFATRKVQFLSPDLSMTRDAMRLASR